MNRVEIIGRLTREPSVNYTKGDNPLCVAKYTLAVDRYRGKNHIATDFIPCVAFGKKGEFAGKYFSKGMRVAVAGKIQTRTYTNNEDRKIFIVEVVVDDQEFCDSRQPDIKEQDPEDIHVFENSPVDEEIRPEEIKDSPYITDLPDDIFDDLPFA